MHQMHRTNTGTHKQIARLTSLASHPQSAFSPTIRLPSNTHTHTKNSNGCVASSRYYCLFVSTSARVSSYLIQNLEYVRRQRDENSIYGGQEVARRAAQMLNVMLARGMLCVMLLRGMFAVRCGAGGEWDASHSAPGRVINAVDTALLGNSECATFEPKTNVIDI